MTDENVTNDQFRTQKTEGEKTCITYFDQLSVILLLGWVYFPTPIEARWEARWEALLTLESARRGWVSSILTMESTLCDWTRRRPRAPQRQIPLVFMNTVVEPLWKTNMVQIFFFTAVNFTLISAFSSQSTLVVMHSVFFYKRKCKRKKCKRKKVCVWNTWFVSFASRPCFFRKCVSLIRTITWHVLE